MSLDETYDALCGFAKALEEFDEVLRAGQRELATRHEEIDMIWRDQLRTDYDIRMGELESQLAHYTGSQSEQLEHFIQTKIAQLGSYLNGK